MRYLLILFFLICASSSHLNAQLIKNNFFEGLVLDGYLEKGEYFSTNSGKDSLLSNQWNLSGDNNLKNGFNPIMGEPLFYEGYIESGKSLSFTQPKLTNGESRASGYSLTNTNIYSKGTYYLAFMLNVKPSTSVTTLNPGIIMFDQSYLIQDRKVGVSVAMEERGYSYKIGIVEDDAANGRTAYAHADRKLIFGKTYLLVLKYNFESGRAELFIDPSLVVQEPVSDVAITINDKSAERLRETGIQAITVRQRTNHSEVFGGLRFATTWKAAIGKL